MKAYEKLVETLQNTDKDVYKFYEKGNSSAGTRIRKAMQEVKRLAQELRVDIQNVKNAK